MRIVIALGGNALGETPEKQKQMAEVTASYIVPIIKKGYEVIISHGNGPQVGLINLAFVEGKKNNSKVFDMPFSECGAMSQGYIGFHLENALVNELEKNGVHSQVVTLVTLVQVDENDPAFLNPTKPIGSFYSKEEAENMPYVMKEDAGRGYRRGSASPKPQRVINMNAIKGLSEAGYVVITCGGGGIPVVKSETGYKGIDAVIDKDYASSKLANDIDADMLLILTAVDCCSINFGKEDEQKLNMVTVNEMIEYNNQGHFYAGSMKPKVEACIDFVKNNNERCAIITSIEKALDAIDGRAGTIIRN